MGEPLDAVFAGHEHFYERIKPQKGIYYFVSDAAGQLRKGDLHRSEMTAAGFDQDQSFMLNEIDGDDLFFQLFQNAAHTTVWGSSFFGVNTPVQVNIRWARSVSGTLASRRSASSRIVSWR